MSENGYINKYFKKINHLINQSQFPHHHWQLNGEINKLGNMSKNYIKRIKTYLINKGTKRWNITNFV